MDEMYSFDFGPTQFIQEHNLRTYLPRPRPSVSEWVQMSTAFADLLIGPLPTDYEELVRRLRRHDDPAAVCQALEEYLRGGGTFGLPLAHRLIDRPDDRLAVFAAEHAAGVLESRNAGSKDLSIAAALVADFGMPQQQESLLGRLQAGAKEPDSSPRVRSVGRRCNQPIHGKQNRLSPPAPGRLATASAALRGQVSLPRHGRCAAYIDRQSAFHAESRGSGRVGLEPGCPGGQRLVRRASRSIETEAIIGSPGRHCWPVQQCEVRTPPRALLDKPAAAPWTLDIRPPMDRVRRRLRLPATGLAGSLVRPS